MRRTYIRVCTWGAVVKTYSTVFLSSACQLLLIINIFKSTVKTSETNLMHICNTVLSMIAKNLLFYPSNSSWHGRSSFLFFASGWVAVVLVIVIVLETWPYRVVVSTLVSVVTPASNSATKSCGTEEAGSHVALHSGIPNHRTYNKTWWRSCELKFSHWNVSKAQTW